MKINGNWKTAYKKIRHGRIVDSNSWAYQINCLTMSYNHAKLLWNCLALEEKYFYLLSPGKLAVIQTSKRTLGLINDSEARYRLVSMP